jgi:hypothetical protein
MKTLTNISFTDHGRETAGECVRELEDIAPERVPVFIKRLEQEFESIQSINHQMLNSGDVIRVFEKLKHERTN